MASNFTVFYSWLLKIVNYGLWQFSQIPYINIFIGLFFIGAFIELAVILIPHIQPMGDLKPLNHGFLNVFSSGGLFHKDLVPVSAMKINDFYRYDRQSVNPILHGNDDFYRYGTSSLVYESAGSIQGYGGSLGSIGNSGLNVIGSNGLGSVFSGGSRSLGGIYGLFANGSLSPFNTRVMSDSHTSLSLGGMGRDLSAGVGKIVNSVDRFNKEQEKQQRQLVAEENKEWQRQETIRYHDNMVEAHRNQSHRFTTYKVNTMNVDNIERQNVGDTTLNIDRYDKHITNDVSEF